MIRLLNRKMNNVEDFCLLTPWIAMYRPVEQRQISRSNRTLHISFVAKKRKELKDVSYRNPTMISRTAKLRVRKPRISQHLHLNKLATTIWDRNMWPRVYTCDMKIVRIVAVYCNLLKPKNLRFLIVYLLLVYSVNANTGQLTRIVHTKHGKMQGVLKSAVSGKHLKPVEVFLGVPYAAPPARFSPTRTLTPWEGVKLFNKFGPVCPQWLPDINNETEALERMPRARLEHLKRLLPFLQNQSEDCLNLNIYAPAQGEYPIAINKYCNFSVRTRLL